MKNIRINECKLECYNYTEDFVVSSPTKNILRKISFNLDIVGKCEQEKIGRLINGTFDVEIDDYKFKAEANNNSWTYEGNMLDNSTNITYYIEVQELDRDLPDGHNPLLGLREEVIANWARTRALSELLVEKGIIAEQEYVDKIKVVLDRDYEEMFNIIVYGLNINN